MIHGLTVTRLDIKCVNYSYVDHGSYESLVITNLKLPF